MLTKTSRLKRKNDFARVFKRGKSFKEETLLLKVLPGNSAKSRFGIVVSQKISKKASFRNKVRRRISSAISQKLPFIKNNFDVVIVALPGVGEKDFWQIGKMITCLFKKAKIVKES